ncbi:fused MFS/spermidine synthase [Pseudoalteromonas sp. JBTF-M23]|uniref:Fused MFS/spermidine synthase n=1 Tax=Pseudoalteromonas caenipelagi TaxID=2726988 RepID=A0A849VJX8_9GAMM|nr:fused MFS/spermidine synthase [Pseudoalteromonas caenipelagi]NOU51917.1 fused MFS/spermidine synthase [Pseudoalteromonas caenipelagi]
MHNFVTAGGTIANQFVQQSHQLGHLLYWHKHGDVSIQVRQDKTLRWLLINNTLQSVVERNHPERLLFPHLQILESIWKNLPCPENVLELGLGGGAIRDYLQAVYPQCKVFSVDNNPDIVHCYKKYFSTEQGCSVACMDADTALSGTQHYDWIILDLFSEMDAPLFLYQHPFYQLLRAALNPNGWLFINFLCEHDSQRQHLEHLLITNFGKKPHIQTVANYANNIIAIRR